jgi:hypothetical protein
MTYIKMNRFKDALATFENANELLQTAPYDPYDAGRVRFGLALSLEGLRRDHARAVALVKQANEDFTKAQGGESLPFYRDATARFLKDAANNP